jgi:hypothetical protein
MLVSALTTECLREWSETDDDTSKVSLVESWIRNALDDFALLTEFRVFYSHTTINTVATTENYTLPAAYQSITAIRRTADNTLLEQKDRQELLLSETDLTTAGKPRIWFYVNSDSSTTETKLRIQLFPVPDAIYAIEYSGTVHPAELVSTDVIPVHNEHLNIIKDRVRYYYAMDEKDYEAADRHDASFVRKAQLIISRENKRPAQRRMLRVSDVPSTREEFVRPDPTHYPR